MYVGTIVEWEDQSQITSLPINDVRTQPLYLSLFTSDKGPEDWTVLSGTDWFNAYGNSISFAKHGQPLLQAAMSINAGARLLSKRLVASDATLANLSIVASVASEEVQAKNAAGQLLYTDAEGNDTTEATDAEGEANTAKMVNVAKIKYEAKSVENITENSPKAVYDAVKASISEGSYLLYTITDNGRGTSNKRFSINPDYRLSRSKTYVEYSMNITESGISIESMSFNPCPNMVTTGSNHSLQSVVATNSSQICCIQDDDGINGLIAKIAEVTEMTEDEVKSIDFIFGCNKKGNAVDTIVVDDTGIALNSSMGQALLEGGNGSMGETPITATEEYVAQAEYALGSGEDVYDTAIFNLDQYKIDLIIDANYPEGVKRAIETLVTFREDCVFMRDYGLGLDSFDKISAYNAEIAVKNKFIADYPISYDIIDPYSKKQIAVTVGYSLATLMVNHLNSGRILPVCGIKHDMIITDAIKGTLNFSPVVCPDPLGNQKEAMEEIRTNYASYIGEDLVLETEYTSQDELTQFSFLNNVLGTQEVVRAIRTRCPVIRYSFIDGEDLERYKADIDDVVSQYQSNFKSIEFEYVNDPTYVNNKIFYAALKVCHRDFIQTEWFKVTAINISES